MELLTPNARADVQRALTEAIAVGLERDGTMIKALDAQIGPPAGDLRGRALVVDIGGTNMRAAIVNIDGTRSTIVEGPIAERLELRDGDETREAFFRSQAELAARLDAASGLPVGYCFSYPSEVLPSLDARLLRWTKGIAIPGVVGTLVGEGLKDAIEATGSIVPSVSVLNDTVASLLGGALSEAQPTNVIGLIAGTGSNMAAFFDSATSPKLRPHHDGPVALNLETGNFHPPHLTDADDRVDQTTDPGRQRFEKAVSGYFLPFLYREMGGTIDVELGSGELVRRRDEAGDELAEAILRRSAQLVARGLAAVADARGDDGEVVVLAEGSLFWGDPQFRPTVEAELELALGARSFRIERRADANLIGSAVAALTQRTVR